MASVLSGNRNFEARIHQNIIARPNLSNSQHLQALFELAQDYFKAGLFDRAESLLLELADAPSHAEQALRYLSQLYEQEKEWEKAIEAGQQLDAACGDDAEVPFAGDHQPALAGGAGRGAADHAAAVIRDHAGREPRVGLICGTGFAPCTCEPTGTCQPDVDPPDYDCMWDTDCGAGEFCWKRGFCDGSNAPTATPCAFAGWWAASTAPR